MRGDGTLGKVVAPWSQRTAGPASIGASRALQRSSTGGTFGDASQNSFPAPDQGQVRSLHIHVCGLAVKNEIFENQAYPVRILPLLLTS